MRYARISFPSRDDGVRAVHELARDARIMSVRDGQFIVPEPAMAILQARGIVYEPHEWMTEDQVTQALRDAAPDPA